jgi:hypothetical protein
MATFHSPAVVVQPARYIVTRYVVQCKFSLSALEINSGSHAFIEQTIREPAHQSLRDAGEN